MKSYSLSKRFEWSGAVTDKVGQTMRMFGLTVEAVSEKSVTHECTLDIAEGDIVYITGPSGCGKSVLLAELEKAIPASRRVNLAQIDLPSDKTVIDCIDGELVHGLRLLSYAGLNDCLCILNSPAYLSDGQKYRFRLAMALAAGKKFIFADEFCANLDRITASVIAWNVRQFAKRNKVTFVLAAGHNDILADLAPDVIVSKEISGPAEVVYKHRKRNIDAKL